MNIKQIDSLGDPKHLKIRWSMSNLCNYKCVYCTAHDGDSPGPKNLELIVSNFDKLFYRYESLGYNKFSIEITGGEPTLWSELHVFIDKIKSKRSNVDVQIISNGSRTYRWWSENSHLIDKINFSYHHAQANLNEFIKVVDVSVKNGVDATVLVLMDPYNWDKCVSAIQYMKKHRTEKWFIEAKPVFPIDGFSVSYTDEQMKFMEKPRKSFPGIKWFIKNALKLKPYESSVTFDNDKTKSVSGGFYVANGYTNFKGWKCNIELENIYIHWNGVIKGSCGQPLYDKDYNILSETFCDEFNVVPAPSVCQRLNCFCQPETHVSKIKLS